ncbi:hypothetical protein J1N35_012476 [Gossypium stocksii]|uniref:Uncharacterized protein n=1 Tax=Gossypium stocksii TaxID=47602 RepID=A0A9D3W6C8_9ROSI|nr:hypothetical protein J1N35_012476 [Gossypium stocksii]
MNRGRWEVDSLFRSRYCFPNLYSARVIETASSLERELLIEMNYARSPFNEM